MVKPNYQFEKRQREQQKKLKKVEKAQRKAQATPSADTDNLAPAQQDDAQGSGMLAPQTH